MNDLVATFARLFLVLAILILTWSVYAADSSPLGLWKTIDDNTGQPRGLVRIREVNGQYEGKVEKIFPKPDEQQNPNTCPSCQSHYRDDELAAELYVCRQCGHHFPMPAWARIEWLADGGTFVEEAAAIGWSGTESPRVVEGLGGLSVERGSDLLRGEVTTA